MRMYLAAFLLAAAACGGAASDAPTTTATTAEPAPVTEPAPASEAAPAEGELPAEVVADAEQTLELLARLADAVEAGGCDGIGARLDAAVTDADVAKMQGYAAKQAEYAPYQAQIEARYKAAFEAEVIRIISGSQGCGAEVRVVFDRLGIGVEAD